MSAGTKSSDEGLSFSTLVIAALASAAAAVLVAQFSESGSAMAAALMAIFVPLLREAFHRPARAISDVRSGRRYRAPMAAAGGGAAAAAVAEREASPTEVTVASGEADATTSRFEADPGSTTQVASGPEPAEQTLFGGGGVPGDMLASDDETGRLDTSSEHETRRIADEPRWPDEETRAVAGGAAPASGASAGAGERVRPSASPLGRNGASPASGGARRVLGRRPRVRIAVVTGVLAFLIAAVAITVPELIAGDSIGGGDGRTTLFSGGGGSDATDDSGSDDAVQDGALDGDGGSPSDSDSGDSGGGSSEPVPGGGGASENGGSSGGGGGGGAGEGSSPAPGGAPDGAEGGGGSGAAPKAAPSGGSTPAP